METFSVVFGQRKGFLLLFSSLATCLFIQIVLKKQTRKPADRNPATTAGGGAAQLGVDGLTLQPHRLPLVSGITSCLPRHLIYIPLEFLFLLNNNKQPRTVIAFVGRGHERAFLGVGNVLCFVLSGGHTGVCTLKNVLSCTPNICTLYVNYSLIFLKKLKYS